MRDDSSKAGWLQFFHDSERFFHQRIGIRCVGVCAAPMLHPPIRVPAMTKPAALYAQLSPGETLRTQMYDLLDIACRSGCEIVATLADGDGIQTADSQRETEFRQIVNGVARPDVGLVMGWTVDRLGRSLQHLVITPVENAPIRF